MFTYRFNGNRLVKVVRGVYNAGGEGGEGGGNQPQTFTQEQVNQFLAAERRKEQDKNKKIVDELNQLKQAEGTSKQRVAELEETIKSIESTYLSKEELTKRELDKKQKEAEETTKRLQSESEFWKGRFNNQLVSSALTQAAVANEAYSHEQILTLLGGKSKVTRVIKDGKETEQFEVKVIFDDHDKDGNPLTLEISPDAALKRMKELPKRFGNLFKGAISGVGGDNNGPGGTTGKSLADLAKSGDTAAFREARKSLK